MVNWQQGRHALNELGNRPRALLWVLGAAALAAVLTAASFAVPAKARAGEELKTLRAATEQMRVAVANLKKEQTEQIAAAEREKAGPQRAMVGALSSGGYSEDDVAYWRKQMDAYGQMSGLRMTITGRTASSYQHATRISVQIASASSIAMSPEQLVRALDFLQLYGHIESFNGSEAVLHVKGA